MWDFMQNQILSDCYYDSYMLQWFDSVDTGIRQQTDRRTYICICSPLSMLIQNMYSLQSEMPQGVAKLKLIYPLQELKPGQYHFHSILPTTLRYDFNIIVSKLLSACIHTYTHSRICICKCKLQLQRLHSLKRTHIAGHKAPHAHYI